MSRILVAAVFIVCTVPVYAQAPPSPPVILAVDVPPNTPPTAIVTIPQHVEIMGGSIGSALIYVIAWTPTGPRVTATAPHRFDPTRQAAMDRWHVTFFDLPLGTYPIVAYAVNVATNDVNTQVIRYYTIRPCVWQPHTDYVSISGNSNILAPIPFYACQ